MIPKIVFSLVFMGGGERHTYLAYFCVHQMDERFRGSNFFMARNGWSVRSSCVPDISVSDRKIYLQGSDRPSDTRPDFLTFTAESSNQARIILQEIVEALKDWSENCPCFAEETNLVHCTPEVRESLIAAQLSEEESSEEDADTPAPIYFDEFTHQKSHWRNTMPRKIFTDEERNKATIAYSWTPSFSWATSVSQSVFATYNFKPSNELVVHVYRELVVAITSDGSSLPDTISRIGQLHREEESGPPSFEPGDDKETP